MPLLPPFSHTTLKVPKVLLQEAETIAGIDRGSTLTKVLYGTEDKESEEHIILNFVLFVNEKFEEALDWMKEYAILPKDGELRITGVGCDKYLPLIEEKLGLKAVFISEFLAHVRGAHFLLSHFDDKEMCYPDEEVPDLEVELSETFKKTIAEQVKEIDRNTKSGQFPFIFGLCGSGIAFCKIDEEGKFEMLGSPGMGGKTFMGLNKLLLGTGDYDEIMKLAEAGDRRNIDNQVKEMIADAGDDPGPYGRYPPDEPMWSFGKAVDQDKGLEDFKREDIAASLPALLGSLFFTSVTMCMRAVQCNRVYLGGNIVRNGVLRKEISLLEKFLGAGLMTQKMKFLNIGHTAAIGAMLTSQEKQKQHLEKGKN